MTPSEPRPFFSVIVPAHNEEKYIEDTLRCLSALDYPKECFEVVVIENGSTDNTAEKAKAFEGANIRVLCVPAAGVAGARNRGMNEASKKAEWYVLLDADTHLAPRFLEELSALVSTDTKKTLAVGGTSVAPFPASSLTRAWYGFEDFLHEVFRHTANITLVRAELATNVRFDEKLMWMEDLRFVADMKKKGRYFFMRTNLVSTSIRRRQQDGWLRLLLINVFVGVLPKSLQQRFVYAPVR